MELLTKENNHQKKQIQDKKFAQERSILESQVKQADQAKQESSSLLNEMDDFLKDLDSWKKTREQKLAAAASQSDIREMQPAAPVKNVFTTQEDVGVARLNELNQLEQDLHKKAEQREKQLLDQLKALEMNDKKEKPAGRDGKSRVLASANSNVSKNSTYMEIVKEIEEKDKLRQQKEQAYRNEAAIEEIKLTEDRQARVDQRK